MRARSCVCLLCLFVCICIFSSPVLFDKYVVYLLFRLTTQKENSTMCLSRNFTGIGRVRVTQVYLKAKLITDICLLIFCKASLLNEILLTEAITISWCCYTHTANSRIFFSAQLLRLLKNIIMCFLLMVLSWFLSVCFTTCHRDNLLEEMLQEPDEIALKRKRTRETLRVLQQAFKVRSWFFFIQKINFLLSFFQRSVN